MLKGWRTILANTGAIAAAVFTALHYPAETSAAYTAIAVAVANVILRMITDTPVGAPVPPAPTQPEQHQQSSEH